jgi:molecular chaperone GrpE
MSEHDESEPTASRGRGDGQAETDPTRSEAETTQGEARCEADASGEDAEPAVPLTPDELLAEARREANDNFERFLRAKADIENILKRHQRELSERARYDGEALARDILSAVDDLERALEHSGSGEGAGDKSVSGGVELVLKGLIGALKRNGVERIEAAGKPFDPAEHEAVTMVETTDCEPGTVVTVFRPGYRLRDRLLRAAMVSVSKAPESKS